MVTWCDNMDILLVLSALWLEIGNNQYKLLQVCMIRMNDCFSFHLDSFPDLYVNCTILNLITFFLVKIEDKVVLGVCINILMAKKVVLNLAGYRLYFLHHHFQCIIFFYFFAGIMTVDRHENMFG